MFDATLRDRWSMTGSSWRMDVPAGWRQGRSLFGGLTVASAAALARRHVEPARALRTTSSFLLRPVTSGALHAELRVLREGKTTTFTEVRLAQDGHEVAVIGCVFTKPTQSALRVDGPMWEGPPVDGLADLPYLEGVMPEFTQHVAFRWASGAPPYSRATDPRFAGYCRFHVPAGDIEGVLGLLDVWPNPSISMLDSFAPASTVTWTAHVVAVPESFDQWFGFSYETIAGRDGFHTVLGRLYDASGQLIGITEQLVAVFEKT